MAVEELAYKMFERNASTYTEDINDIKFYWLTEDDVRSFWIEEARAVIGWLKEWRTI